MICGLRNGIPLLRMTILLPWLLKIYHLWNIYNTDLNLEQDNNDMTDEDKNDSDVFSDYDAGLNFTD